MLGLPPRFVQWQRRRRRVWLGVLGWCGPWALTSALPACGDGAAGGSLMSTISECQQLGGSPLFDPEDERPIEQSCPEGLRYIGQFSEPFFGSDGGICCAQHWNKRGAALPTAGNPALELETPPETP